jgi:hypothetical protein
MKELPNREEIKASMAGRSWGPQQCRKKPPDILQIPLINLVLRYQKCLDFRLASL